MSDKDMAEKLKHYLSLYSICHDQKYIDGILIYSAMLAGKILK